MNWHLWLGFVAAAFVIGVIPGPAVTSIVGYALGSGRKAALASVAGMSVGSVIAMSLSLGGGPASLVGPALFPLIQSRGKPQADAPPSPAIRPRTAFFSNVLLGSFHPK